MRFLALIFSSIAVAFFAWPHIENWILDDEITNTDQKAEIFAFTMKNIRPVKNLNTYVIEISEQKKAEMKKHMEARSQAQRDKIRIQQTKEIQAINARVEQDMNLNEADKKAQEALDLYCMKVTSVPTSALPAINRTIQKEGLLEYVEVEPILSKDRWVVFIVPVSSSKGAQALMRQVKRQGFGEAKVVTDGPLLNAVVLDTFDEEHEANSFLLEVKNKIKVQAVRVTRLIGEPTENVNLLFSQISKKQTEAVKNIGRYHQKAVSACF